MASANRRRRSRAESSTSAISRASVHAVQAATGKAAWTFKTDGEIKSSPVVSGDRVLIGSYDSNLYALGAKDREARLEGADRRLRARHAAVVDGVAYIAGCDEILRGIRIRDGREVFEMSSGAYTGASPAISTAARTTARTKTRCSRSI